MRNVGPQKSKKFSFTFISLLMVLGVMYWIEIFDWLIFGGSLDKLGVQPRELFGLIGIPLMPFLHGGFAHLFSNTFPLLILGFIVLKSEKKNFLPASFFIILLGGLGTWLIGRGGSVHVGASGLIYGYFGYIMFRGLSEKKLGWVILAIVVGLFYGGMIWGVLPSVENRVSWEGHLCGMIAGAWYGRTRALKNRGEQTILDV